MCHQLENWPYIAGNRSSSNMFLKPFFYYCDIDQERREREEVRETKVEKPIECGKSFHLITQRDHKLTDKRPRKWAFSTCTVGRIAHNQSVSVRHLFATEFSLVYGTPNMFSLAIIHARTQLWWNDSCDLIANTNLNVIKPDYVEYFTYFVKYCILYIWNEDENVSYFVW